MPQNSVLLDIEFPFTESIRTSVFAAHDPEDSDARPGVPQKQLSIIIRRLRADIADPAVVLRRRVEEKASKYRIAARDEAIIRWLTLAFDTWRQQGHLETKPFMVLRKVLPVFMVEALHSDDFFIPGAHAYHEAMEIAYDLAIGIPNEESRLQGALLAQLNKYIDGLLALNLTPGSIALKGAVLEYLRQARKDRVARARERLKAERREVSSLAALARQQKVSELLNAYFERHLFAQDSASLLRDWWCGVGLKTLQNLPDDTSAWAEYERVTGNLISTLAVPDGPKDGMRDHVLASLKTLPGEIESCLGAIHAPEADVRRNLSVLESIHRKVIRGVAERLVKAQALPEPLKDMDGAASQDMTALSAGDWVLLRDKGRKERKRILAIDTGNSVISMCGAGYGDVLRVSFAEVVKMMDDGVLEVLATRCSFSRALATAAGIETEEDYALHLGVPTRRESGAPRVESIFERDLAKEEAEILSEEERLRAAEAARRAKRLQMLSAGPRPSAFDVQPGAEFAAAAESPAHFDSGDTGLRPQDKLIEFDAPVRPEQVIRTENATPDDLTDSQPPEEATADDVPELTPTTASDVTPPEAPPFVPSPEPPPAPEPDTLGPHEDESTDEVLLDMDDLLESVNLEDADDVTPEVPVETVEEVASDAIESDVLIDLGELTAGLDLETESDNLFMEPATQQPRVETLPGPDAQLDAEIELTIGDWYGFHDKDQDAMGKLVAFDSGPGDYIFANSSGVMIRRISPAKIRSMYHDGALLHIVDRRPLQASIKNNQ